MVIDPICGMLLGCDDGNLKEEGVEIEEVKARAIMGNKRKIVVRNG